MSELQDALDVPMKHPDWLAAQELIREAARRVADGPTVWLCVENHPNGLRITNLPGGPGDGMCYFTGQHAPHLELCGEYTLAARR